MYGAHGQRFDGDSLSPYCDHFCLEKAAGHHRHFFIFSSKNLRITCKIEPLASLLPNLQLSTLSKPVGHYRKNCRDLSFDYVLDKSVTQTADESKIAFGNFEPLLPHFTCFGTESPSFCLEFHLYAPYELFKDCFPHKTRSKTKF